MCYLCSIIAKRSLCRSIGRASVAGGAIIFHISVPYQIYNYSIGHWKSQNRLPSGIRTMVMLARGSSIFIIFHQNFILTEKGQDGGNFFYEENKTRKADFIGKVISEFLII